ncbi:MAG: hypothetical protein EOM50_12755 [Erysipelotrichia bacterium]|nr:hypothetical protein [Erysipelotrichia bacterium]
MQNTSITEISEEEVEKEYKKLKGGTSPGPSGLDKDNCSFVKRNEREFFVRFLTVCFNALLENPNKVAEIPELF